MDTSGLYSHCVEVDRHRVIVNYICGALPIIFTELIAFLFIQTVAKPSETSIWMALFMLDSIQLFQYRLEISSITVHKP